MHQWELYLEVGTVRLVVETLMGFILVNGQQQCEAENVLVLHLIRSFHVAFSENQNLLMWFDCVCLPALFPV